MGDFGRKAERLGEVRKGLPVRDRHPKRYVEKFENKPPSTPTDYSLGIGSMKGK